MRIKIVLVVLVLVWVVLLGRIYQLTIRSNTYYRSLARQNIVKKVWIMPIRGEILDRHGEPLAINKIGFSLSVSPHLSGRRHRARLLSLLREVHRAFPDSNVTKMLDRYIRQDSPYRHDPIVMREFIPYEVALPHFVEFYRKKDIDIEPTTKRYYPYGDMTAHVIGYVGKANEKEMEQDKVVRLLRFTGKSGLEKYYNTFLEGKPGYKKIKVSAFNEDLGVLEDVPPVENRNITLYLDMALQKYIADIFRKEKKTGAAIVMRVDGAVLAAGSFPAYDPNDFVTGISSKAWKKIIEDFNHPFTNKLIHGLYPPGSVIKPGVSVAFLESSRISPSTSFFCNGAIELGRTAKHKFRCWKHGGHGKTDMTKAIRESCDVYFYKGSLQVGIDAIAKELRKMGLGRKTGIDLPNEFLGVVPDKSWKQRKYGMPWYMGETLNSAIGQGYVLTTPMQIADYTALLASGRLPTPRLVNKLADKTVPLKSLDVLSYREKRELRAVRKAMYQVCNHPKGTAYWPMRGLKIEVAGKTGTAQVIGIPQQEKKRMKEEELAYYHRSHAWLTTFAPYRHPQYVVTIIVEHGGHGGHAAGPIAKKIYQWLIEHGYIHVGK